MEAVLAACTQVRAAVPTPIGNSSRWFCAFMTSQPSCLAAYTEVYGAAWGLARQSPLFRSCIVTAWIGYLVRRAEKGLQWIVHQSACSMQPPCSTWGALPGCAKFEVKAQAQW